jgi:fumarate reductase flavoprotein subunit
MGSHEGSRRNSLTRMTRRGFLTTAGVGLIAAAGSSALVGCTPNSEKPSEAAVGEASVEVSWAEEYDVIIVGSGAAGFASALSVLQEDATASVVVYEQLDMIGGNSALNRGNYGACGTDIQIKQGEDDEAFRDDNPDLYFSEKCKLGDYRMDPKLTRIFADNSLDGYHWLNNLGVSFQKVGMYDEPVPLPENPQGLKLHMCFNADFKDGTWIGPQTKGRHHKSATYQGVTGGNAAIGAMQDAANVLGDLSVVTGTKVTGIIREKGLSGEVLGVFIQKQGDVEQAIQAKRAVIITAGGFSANTEMVTKHDPRVPVDAINTGCAGVDGSAIIAAQDIGADVRGMDFIQHTFELSGTDKTAAPLFLKRGEYINVDGSGKRFWTEMENKATFRDGRVTLLHELGHNSWWSVTDTAAAERLKLSEEDLNKAIDAGLVFKAETVEDLASVIGVPSAVLVETVNRWNGFVDAGVDEDFGQEKRYLHRVDQAPFYAESRCYYIHSTPGGLRITEKTEVVDRVGDVIPRLFAAGEVTGGVHGTERNGGCSWTDCVVFGRIAGAQAAAFK